MNQYERGKHLPDLLTIERLAHEVGVPSAYFFADEDKLAELLAMWKGLDEAGREELLAMTKALVETKALPSQAPSHPPAADDSDT